MEFINDCLNTKLDYEAAPLPTPISTNNSITTSVSAFKTPVSDINHSQISDVQSLVPIISDSDSKNDSDPRDIYFMNKALKLAQKAYSMDEAPIGAVIVKDDKIIARGWNTRETSQNILGHAEIMALLKAGKKLKSWRLEECEIYVTLEPCFMCAGAISQSRIKRLVFGALDPKGGAICSLSNIFTDNILNHRLIFNSKVCEFECQRILKDFFKELRTRRRYDKSRRNNS